MRLLRLACLALAVHSSRALRLVPTEGRRAALGRGVAAAAASAAASLRPAVAAAAGRLTPAMAAARSVGVAAAAAPVATSGAAMTPPELLVETVAGDKPGEGPTLEAPPPARASWIAVCAGGAVALAVALRRRSFGAVGTGRASRQYTTL
mmetsp:Transcript_14180/g.45771  ORF Transcript_14180/g.45771 Transcript_14180/m.45771 type:complete len:150 (+) Transcript_14180:40-489(+)